MLNETETRLEGGFEKLDELAQQYAGTDKVCEQVVAILREWFITGYPQPNP